MVTMSLAEAQSLKSELDAAIMDLLQEFREETGLVVESIEVSTASVLDFSGERLVIVGVKSEVPLG